MNTLISKKAICNSIFLALSSKNYYVLETFFTNKIGMKRVRLYKWISTLTPEEVETSLLCLSGEILDGFKVEFIHDSKLCLEDHLYMLTSNGVQRWLNYYKSNFTTNRSQKNEIDTLAQRILESFTERRNSGFVHLGFWETNVEDVINIPDMPSINISHSPGAIVSTGDNNHQVNSNNTHQVHSNNNNTSDGTKNKKPAWVIWISWIFILGSLIWFAISILCKFNQASDPGDVTLDWREVIQFIGFILGILLKTY